MADDVTAVLSNDVADRRFFPSRLEKNWFYLETSKPDDSHRDAKFTRILFLAVSVIVGGACIIIGVTTNLVSELSFTTQVLASVWALSIFAWPVFALLVALLYFARRRPIPKNTVNVGKIQGLVSALVRRGILTYQPTALCNALVAQVQYPRRVELPLQLAQLFVISTALAVVNMHHLPDQYIEYRKVKREKRKAGTATWNEIFHYALDKTFNSLDGDADRLALFETLAKMCRLVDFYQGLATPARHDTFSHNMGYYIARLHQHLFEISTRHRIDLEGAVLEWLHRIDDKDSMEFRKILSLLVDKPPAHLVGHLDYNPAMTKASERFNEFKQLSQCIFASASRIWSAPDWDEKLSLEDNVKRAGLAFTHFIVTARVEHLDGFVIEVPDTPDGRYGGSPDALGRTMYRTLMTLNACDPGKEDSMHQDLNRTSWQFTYNHQRIFITSFAPCFPETSPRYAFGSKSCWILLQPEFSFSYHKIPPHRVPGGPRQKIRDNFEKAGRPFERPSRHDLMGHVYVKPLDDVHGPRITWWPDPPQHLGRAHRVISHQEDGEAREFQAVTGAAGGPL